MVVAGYKVARWTNDKDAAFLLAWIDKRMTRNGAHWESKDVDIVENLNVLTSLVRFGNDIPDSTRRSIVSHALGRVPPEHALSLPSVLVEVNKGIAEYRSLPPLKFVLLTTASLRLPTPTVVIPFRGQRILLTRRRPRTFKMPSLLEAQEPGGHVPPRGYCTVRVHVNARCALSAFDLALTTFDYLRSLWNLWANRRKFSRWSSSARKNQVNEVLVGPLHTVHHADGTAALEGYWTDDVFREQPPSSLLVEHYDAVRSFEKRMKRLVARALFRPDIVDILVRYTRALDDPDMTACFLKLWSVLEQLVIRGDEGSKKLAHRASFIYLDREYHDLVLRQLAVVRHGIVHRSDIHDRPRDNPEEAESLVFLLKRYVESVLLYVLRNSHHFNDATEFLSFLDLPHGVDQLKRGLHLRRIAHRFLTPKTPA